MENICNILSSGGHVLNIHILNIPKYITYKNVLNYILEYIKYLSVFYTLLIFWCLQRWGYILILSDFTLSQILNTLLIFTAERFFFNHSHKCSFNLILLLTDWLCARK